MPTSARASTRHPQVPAPRTAQISGGGFVVPLVHVHLSEPAVTRAFYGGLAAAVVLGAVDLPVGVLVGLGVAIARHRRT
jgi:hypothetical protein